MNLALIDRTRTLRRTVAGRLIQICADTERILTDRPQPRVSFLLDEARTRARKYLILRQQRAAQRDARADGRAAELDAETDILVGIVHETCTRFARRMPDTARGRAGKRILRRLFPRGLAAVVSVPYEDELVLVEYIHAELAGPMADEAATLGFEAQVEALGAVLPHYRDALRTEERVSAQDVAEAYEAMQVAYFKLAFGVVSTVADDDLAEALMGPIIQQDDRLAALYAARRNGRSGLPVDVDPDAEAEQALAEEQAAADALADEAEAADAGMPPMQVDRPLNADAPPAEQAPAEGGAPADFVLPVRDTLPEGWGGDDRS